MKGAASTVIDVGASLAGGAKQRHATAASEEGNPHVIRANGPDLLAAMEAAFVLSDVDGVYVVVSDHPKHELASISHRLEALYCTPTMALHIVDFSNSDPLCSHYLKDVIQMYDNACDAAGVTLYNR